MQLSLTLLLSWNQKTLILKIKKINKSRTHFWRITPVNIPDKNLNTILKQEYSKIPSHKVNIGCDMFVET